MLELIGVDGLTQWDVGRQVKVEKDIDMVHFSNRPYGYSKNVKVTDGVADVPDMFLTSCAARSVNRIAIGNHPFLGNVSSRV